jgi:hypothetical protein
VAQLNIASTTRLKWQASAIAKIANAKRDPLFQPLPVCPQQNFTSSRVS